MPVSTLGYALLGLLARRARTGYDLSQALDAPVGYFWTASHSQVYPELGRLEAELLVQPEVIDGPGPRPTKLYHITEAGTSALRDWVATPTPLPPERSEFLLKVYSMWVVDRSRARAMLDAQLALHRAQLAVFEDIEARIRAEAGGAVADPSSPAFCDHATVRRGVTYERDVSEWCQTLLDLLAASEVASGE